MCWQPDSADNRKAFRKVRPKTFLGRIKTIDEIQPNELSSRKKNPEFY